MVLERYLLRFPDGQNSMLSSRGQNLSAAKPADLSVDMSALSEEEMNAELEKYTNSPNGKYGGRQSYGT